MKKENTKRTLLISALAITLCLAMLVGATFAWFTDSASTGVNSIKSGTLDVMLLDENGESVEGRTLAWQKAAGHEDEAILWEPGCTYDLQTVTIKNNGNLALKYKIEITGIDGDAELNDVITWTIKVGDEVVDLDTFEGHLTASAAAALTISGHMEETAGNIYQDKEISGVAITVSATQDTVESDSYGPDYDGEAEYPVPPITEITIDGIEFHVLKTEGTKMLLLAKDCVAIRNFDDDNSTALWEDCELRQWLNNDWLSSMPTLSTMAVNTTLYTVNCSATNPEFYATEDRVFLLSEADIQGTYHCYMNGGGGTPVTNADYYTAGEMLSAPDGDWNTEDNNYWWTRSGNCWGDGLSLVSYWDRDDNEVHAKYPTNGYNFGVRPALWVDTFAITLAETGSVVISTATEAVNAPIIMQTPNANISSSAVGGTVINVLAGPTKGVITFAPQSADDPFFAENDVFNVTLGNNVTIESGEKGNSGIALGNASTYDSRTGLVCSAGYVPVADQEYAITYRAAGKTLNVTGGNFISHSGSGNGAICIANMENCTVNISNATFVVGKSSSTNYAAFISLNTREEMVWKDKYYYTDISVDNTTVTFTNCTFMLDDGTVINPTDVSNPQFGNWFYGFGGESGNKLIIDGVTVIE